MRTRSVRTVTLVSLACRVMDSPTVCGERLPGQADEQPPGSPWAGCVPQTLVLREVIVSDFSGRHR